MSRISIRQKSKRTIVAEAIAAVPDAPSSKVCAVCHLVFGSSERRVLVGDKAAHLRCARRLSEPKRA